MFSYEVDNDSTITTVAESNTNSIIASNISSLPVIINECTDPSILDAINEVEGYINPNSLDEDDVLEVEENDLNNSESLPNNDFCFTKDDFIESINNINDATRYRGNYHFTWNKIKLLKVSNIFLILLIRMVL